MNKGLLLKVFLLCALFCQFVNEASAQYAVGGEAPNGLTSKVYWLTWNKATMAPEGPDFTYPAGFTNSNIATGTYMWQYSPTVRIKAIVTLLSLIPGTTFLAPYTPGSYWGDGLDVLFNGNGSNIKAAGQADYDANTTRNYSKGVPYSAVANGTNGGQVQFNISIRVEILINGGWVDTPYPGMVLADAESLASGEFIQAITESTSVGWQVIAVRRGPKPVTTLPTLPVTDANQLDDYIMTLSTATSVGSTTPGSQFRLQTRTGTGLVGNYNVQAVLYAHGVNSLTKVTVKGAGTTAMGIGFIMPFDMSDAQGYTKTGAYINGFSIANNIPTDGEKKLVGYTITPLVPVANVYLGNNTVVDPDGDNILDATATADDNTTSPGVDDDDSVDPNAVTPLRVNAAGDITSQITKVTNGSASATAKVYAWIDVDGNGKFNDYEAVDAVTPIAVSTTTSSPITLNFSRSNFGSHIKAGTTKMRVRVTTNTLTDNDASTVDGRSESYTGDGEVEDYQVTIAGITVSGNVFHDVNGVTDAAISGTAISSVGTTPQTLIAYLLDNGVVVQKSTVTAGAYSFANVNNSTTAKVAISVNDIAVGQPEAGVLTNPLPVGWAASGETFGTNNNIGTGIDGTTNLVVALSTPGTSQDVTGINFGLTQTPVAVNDVATTNYITAVPINVLTDVNTGDSDPDGTLDATKVFLLNPGTGLYTQSTFTTAQGTYAVNATTGIVTFTPAANFTGTTTAVSYTVKDNGGATSNAATIIITVKPIGTTDDVGTPINTATTTTVLGNDGASATGGVVSLGATAPAHGAVQLIGNTIQYTPTTDYIGPDSYTYKITNNGAVSDEITVNVTIKPIGTTDNVSTPINTATTTTVLANDGTPSATGGVVSLGATAPAHGAVQLIGNTIQYTPTTDYIGPDSYTYKITNNGAVSDEIMVNVTIKPIGTTDNVSTAINTATTTTVLANDGTPSATGGVVSLGATAPAHGAVQLIGNTIQYTPTTDYIGPDSYTYKITNNGAVSDEITVNVTIKPIGTTDNVSTAINTATTTTVLGNDGASATGGVVSLGATTPAHGAVQLIGNTIQYTPTTDYIGPDSYTYKITNNGAVSDDITVNVTIKPAGVNDVASTDINIPVTTVVTSNDGPSGVTPVTVTAGTPPTHGGIIVTGTSITYTPTTGYVGSDTYTYTLTKNGILSDPVTVFVNVGMTGTPDADVTMINTPVSTIVTTNDGASGTGATVTAGNGSNGTTSVSSGTVTYTPNSNFIGIDTYTYTLTKNSATSAPITVTITVKPKGVNDVASTTINTPVSTVVTTNDGPSGVAPVTVTSGTAPTNGIITVNGTTITYTPNTGYLGNDSYTYTLTKNSIVSDPITVSVSVTTLPTGSPDADITTINTPVPTIVTANDASGTGATVTAGNGSNGTTSVSSGTVTYTPNSNFIGIDTYTYTLTKNSATSAPITVTITVKPKGVNDVASTTINTPVSTVVTTNDGPSGVAPVTVTSGTAPTNGNIAVSGTTITYTPTTGYVGNDSYTYTLTKNSILSDPITVSVSVLPVGVDDSDLTPVNTPVITTVTTNDGASGTSATVTPTPGSHGTTTVTGGNVTYTPANGYIGTDTYTYTLTKNSVTSAPITVTINVYSATMSLSKVANNGAAKAGDVINYTLIVKNTGTVNLSNIIITDPGADAGSISPVSVALLIPGATTTFTANHTVVAADVTAGKFSNQATATGKDPKNNTVSKISDDPGTPVFDDPTVVPVTPASINLAKTGVFSGNQVTYTFTITNTGGAALNTITITDAKLGLNGVAVTAPTGGLLPAATITHTAVYTLTQADKDAGVVNNTASVSAKDPYNNGVTGTGSAVTTVPTSPVATNDAAETNSGTSVIVSVLTNDDAKNSTFNLTSIEIVSTPMHGTVVANANGTVTYTPTAGHTGTDSFTYRVKDAYGYYTNVATVTITTNLFVELKIPTLFSPNGDGVNDGFVIKDLAQYAQNELTVLNRWGNEVYKQANYQNNWSGTGLNEGTYFYIVRLKKANGESWLIKKGYVTLIRTFKK